VTTPFRAFLAAVALCLAASPAHAGSKVMVSAPISNDAGGISCAMTNAGKKAVTVSTIETVGDDLGVVVLNLEPIVLDPGGFVGITSGEGFGYCRFTVEGNPKTLRAVACRFEAGTGPGTNADCVEAR
jgi:hypothetical protein